MSPRVTAASFPGVPACATLASGIWRAIFGSVPPPIPPDYETLDVPNIGKIIYFRAGTEWLAVWPDFRDRWHSPIGFGVSPGAAVAELVDQLRDEVG